MKITLKKWKKSFKNASFWAEKNDQNAQYISLLLILPDFFKVLELAEGR